MAAAAPGSAAAYRQRRQEGLPHGGSDSGEGYRMAAAAPGRATAWRQRFRGVVPDTGSDAGRPCRVMAALARGAAGCRQPQRGCCRITAELPRGHPRAPGEPQRGGQVAAGSNHIGVG
jgi:hypothetical protein